MRLEKNQEPANTGSTPRFVIVGAPKRKDPKKRLGLCTKRYSKKRLAKLRLKQLRAWKAQQAELKAAEEAAAQNPAPSSASSEQQCDNENKVPKEEILETEEDFAASISVVFNVLDGTYTIKDDDIDRDQKQICLSPQGSNDAFSGVNAETPTPSSSQAEEMQCEELKTAFVEGNNSVLVKVENLKQYGRKKPTTAFVERNNYGVVKVENLKQYGCKKLKTEFFEGKNCGLVKVENLKQYGCKKLKTEFVEGNNCGVLKVDDFEELGCKKLKDDVDGGDYFVVEKASKIVKPEPFRSDKLCIVDMGYVFEQIKAASKHSSRLGCSTDHLEVTAIRPVGLTNTLVTQCTMCHERINIRTLPSDSPGMNIHHGAVLGTLATGGGYSQLEQFLAALNVSAMTLNMYNQYHDYLTEALLKAAEIEMVNAAEEEKKLAIERGDVLSSGIPYIPVIADGSWMKRSYGTGKFDSPAGCGVIIGFYSKKVLFIGVRNKNCSVCQYAEKNSTPTRDHKCYKNWGRSQPSTKMESDAILEGFKTSLATRGLIYGTLIADGDSSSYRRILECDPYEGMMRVSKIECTNHLLRNFGKKMREIVKKTPRSKYKKTIEASIAKMRTAIGCAAKFRRTEDVLPAQRLENLKIDIMNVPSHIFGEHKECKKIGYFCDGVAKKNEENIVPELIKLGVYDRIQEILRPLLNHGQSLLLNKTNNLVESFNSLIAKYIGAKRVNFSQRGSYLARCSAAVIQFNTKQLFSRLHKVMNREPSSVVRGLERRNQRALDQKRARVAATPRHVRKLIFPEDDQDYGPNVLQPDVEQLPFEFGIDGEIEVGASQSCSQTEMEGSQSCSQTEMEGSQIYSETEMEGSQDYSQSEMEGSQDYSQSQTLTECVDDAEEDENIYYHIQTAEESDMYESQNCSQSDIFTEYVDDAEENGAVAILPMHSQQIYYQIQTAEESDIDESPSCSQSDMFTECVGDAEENNMDECY